MSSNIHVQTADNRPSIRAAVFLAGLFVLLAALGLILFPAAPAQAACGGTTNVSSALDLQNAIISYNAEPGPCVFTIDFDSDIVLTSDLTTISNASATTSLIILGDGFTLDGQGQYDTLNITNSPVTIDNLTVIGSDEHGVRVVNQDPVRLTRVTLAENDNRGLLIQFTPDIVVRDSTIRNNNAVGIEVLSSTFYLINSTITANNGGVWSLAGAGQFGQTTLTNVTIARNHGRGLTADNTDFVPVTVNNSILANNIIECNGLNVTFNNSLIEDTNLNACGLAAANPDGSGNIVGENARIGFLSDNGGPTATIPLLTLTGGVTGDSPAVDAGSNAFALDEMAATLDFDQRGAGFPRQLNGTVDMGAFEGTIALDCPTFPTPVADETDLNEAILCYNAITTPGVYTIDLNANILLSASSLPVDNNTAGVSLIIEGHHFSINGQSNTDVRPLAIYRDTTVTINETLITGGQIDSFGVLDGAGIYNAGNLTLTNSNVTSNVHNEGVGGGIYNAEDAVLVLVDTEVAANSAEAGGGIYSDGESTLTITGSRIASNSAVFDGGGLLADEETVVDITNTTFHENTSGSNGGAIYGDDLVTLIIDNSIITNNDALGNGGGIYTEEDSTVDLTNSTVAGNYSEERGGGLYIDENTDLTIADSSISGNQANLLGGGIHAEAAGTVTITRSLIDNNEVVGDDLIIGGGGIVSIAPVSIFDSTISNNSVRSTSSEAALGGGVLVDSSGLLIKNSTVSGNEVLGAYAAGGGVYAAPSADSAITIINSTVSGNAARGEADDAFVAGGGLVIDNPTFTTADIINSTFSDNEASTPGVGTDVQAGGVAFFGDDEHLSVIVDNSIFANSMTNGAPGEDCVVNGPLFEANFSLFEDTDAGACGLGAAIPDANGNIVGQDPNLGPLVNNGGPTRTHLPLFGSLAINAGSNPLAVDELGDPLTADQRGFTPRIVTTVEMGSVEVDATAPQAGFCPVDASVGTLMTDLIGVGQGNTTKGFRTRKLVIPNADEMASLYGQLAAIDIGLMKYVRFLPQGYPKVQIHAPTSPAYRPYAVDWWGTDLPTDVNWVKGQFFWGKKGNKSPRAFVLWPTYNTDEQYANVFKTFDNSAENHVAHESGFIPTQTQVVGIPQTQADGATVVVRVAIVDNNKDGRPLILTVTAGSVSQQIIDTVPNAKDTLNLYEITLENVEAGVDEVEIMLDSPAPDEVYPAGGDSAAMIGAAVSYACGGATGETGSITIEKELDASTFEGEFDFTGDLGDFSLAPDDEMEFTGLLPGTYTITELLPSGWQARVFCESGETSLNNEISVQLSSGEHIECEFINSNPR